jgi:hypothetical protein
MVRGGKMHHKEGSDDERWSEGLANHERLKKLLPFMNEDDEGYL